MCMNHITFSLALLNSWTNIDKTIAILDHLIEQPPQSYIPEVRYNPLYIVNLV